MVEVTEMKRLAILCGLIMLIPLLLLTAGIGCDISSRDVRAVWGSSSSDVFAVGSNGNILHYDGNKWHQMERGYPRVDGESVWGSSSSDVFAVGWYNHILHYDGTSWSQMKIPLSLRCLSPW
jgi:hypothetical protein